MASLSSQVLRIAMTGSSTWPQEWWGRIAQDLDGQLAKVRSGGTFVLRWGNAQKGADFAAGLWFLDRAAHSNNVRMIAEPVNADWEHCVLEPYEDVRGGTVKKCPEMVNGKPHRRPNRRHNRGSLDTYCPSAGHRRNPDIPAHPDFPVRIIYGYCLDDSPGTLGTIGCAKRHHVNHNLLAIYS